MSEEINYELSGIRNQDIKSELSLNKVEYRKYIHMTVIAQS